MNVNEYGEVFEPTESFINTKRESQDESSDNLQKQKSLGLNRNVSMILDIIDRKNKIVNISENLLDQSDGSDSLKSESQFFNPKESETHAKKRNFQQAIKDNKMRLNFIKNCQAISPKKNDDSSDIESVYSRNSPPRSFQ